MNKMNKSKLLAFAVVAMFAFAIVPVMADDSEANPYGGVYGEGSGSYTVNVSTGQTFTYIPETSLDNYGDIAWTWSVIKGDSPIADPEVKLNTNNGAKPTLSGKFTTAGTYIGTLTATWTPPASDNATGIVQEAEQIITFIVADKIVFSTDAQVVYAQEGSTAAVGTIGFTGGTAGKITMKVEVKGEGENYTEIDHTNNGTPFNFALGTDAITVTPASAVGTDVPDYVYKITLSDSTTAYTAQNIITVNSYDKIKFTIDTNIVYTFENSPTAIADRTFTTDYDDGSEDGVEVSVQYGAVEFTQQSFQGSSANAMASNAGLKNVLTADGQTVTIDVKTNFDKPGYFVGAADYVNYVATVTATGTGPNGTSTEDASFTYKVYRNFQFSTAPTADNITITKTSAGSNSMNLSAYISGAKTIEFIWGDGTTSFVDTKGAIANTYAANHTYAKDGAYMITIKATNDVGTTTSKVLYSVGEEGTVPAEPTPGEGEGNDKTPADKDEGIIAEHGWMFILFGVLTAGCVIAFFVLGYQHPFVIIAAFVFAILTILCYMYVDFGGIIDAVKGLFDGKA